MPQLHGFICSYHPAAPGLIPKYSIYVFFNLYYWNCNEKRTKINKKEAGIGPLRTISKLSIHFIPRGCCKSHELFKPFRVHSSREQHLSWILFMILAPVRSRYFIARVTWQKLIINWTCKKNKIEKMNRRSF